MSFNDFINKYKLKNRATSDMKIQQVVSSLVLNDVGIYLQEGLLSSDIGIVKFHFSKCTHRVLYKNENYFDRYGCSLPQKVAKIIIKRMDIVYIRKTKYKA